MIIKIPQIESYANVIAEETLFYHARNTLTSREDIVNHAVDFLNALSVYEENVPNRIIVRLKSFRDTKDLASVIIDKAGRDAAYKRGKALLHLRSVCPPGRLVPDL